MKLYTNQDLIEQTGRSLSTIDRDRETGKLGGQRAGRSVVYTQAQVDAYKAGKQPPKAQELFGIGQAANMAEVSRVTLHKMIEDGRVEPYVLEIDGGTEYIFNEKMIAAAKKAKLDPGRQIIEDGAYDLVNRTENGRFSVASTTGKTGKPLHYKTHALAIQMARKAIRDGLVFKEGDLVFAKVGAIVNRAVMVNGMTSICLAAWVIVNGTEKPVLVQKRNIRGLVNEEAIHHLERHNYIVIKDRRDV